MRAKLQVVQNMGLSWTLFRARYELEKKLGLLKRQFPAFTYDKFDIETHLTISTSQLKDKVREVLQRSFPQPNKKFFTAEIYSRLNLSNAVIRADRMLAGQYEYFFKHTYYQSKLDWHYSPFKDKQSPKNLHWSEIGDLSSDFGDIKWIWEQSRFTWVYTLVRAYEISKDEKYANAFWNSFEDFIKNNSPELGANYKCGQEMSLRIMAWIFGLNAFIESPTTSDERITLMIKAIYHHANHVEKHFDFALKSVKNNHSLSEAAGMYTVGTVFSFFDKSPLWKRKGLKYIQSEAEWQIYDDGSYIQHSFNYQRLAIQDLTWVLRLGQIAGDKFNDDFLKKFSVTVQFMFQMQDMESGRLPNYGMNDGAYIHPLTSCEYLDHRPALQAAWLTLTGHRLYKDRRIDEIALWLGLDTESPVNAPIQDSIHYREGGYVTTRKNNQFGMIRCATYRHRPAQADMLHLDFWDGPYNLLADAGTYSYNTDQETLLYFNGTASHNTIMVNDENQMKKASRFIWLNWTKSKVNRFETTDQTTVFEGEHYGYSPVVHRRALFHADNLLVVVDDLIGKVEETEIKLNWLFGVQAVRESEEGWSVDLPNHSEWEMRIIGDGISSTLYKGSESPKAGWRSLYYSHKEAFPQLVTNKIIKGPDRIITLFRKDRSPITKINETTLELDRWKLTLNPIGSAQVFNSWEMQ
ncbi:MULTISPECIES: alginate lyase family protein [Bhargavaea]|uniref:Alginate lyase family protein n=1 Tax=Bhargavaea changchunensis TaxID=2134037 RepID=A0ABW2NGR0_9BACL|nr:alginate lyase family protein [Bhargavaea sp. CC-171006]